MLFSLEDIRKTRVIVADAHLGNLREVYFDDQEWMVRYFIVGTSRFLGRDVLIVPEAVVHVDSQANRIELGLTRQQVEGSPPVDFAKPVSRQKAEEYIAYYGWPYFRSAPAAAGRRPEYPDAAGAAGIVAEDDHWDPHLRSSVELTGYRIHGTDGQIGHLEDLLLDDGDWTIRYLVVDTRNWLPGKRVLLLPGSVEHFDWQRREVRVGLSRDAIRRAPPLKPGTPLSRDDESRIHAYFGVSPYWSESTGAGPEGARAPV